MREEKKEGYKKMKEEVRREKDKARKIERHKERLLSTDTHHQMGFVCTHSF